jgi:glutathione reductase (NADPH)
MHNVGMEQFDFDLMVIGGGSGGVRAARMAAQRGARVALAEAYGQAGLGGTCVNLGCIPKKLYSYAAHYAESFAEAVGYGWNLGPATLDWNTLKTHRAREIERLNGVYGNLLKNSGVQVLHGLAAFVDAHTVQVQPLDGGDTTTVRAKTVLIATGGKPFVPAFEGSEHAITSNEMFDLPTVPKRLVVVGAGYIACEFASIFNGLGAQVTQLYRGEQILRGFDDEVRAFAAQEFAKHGVDIRTHTDVAHIDKTTDGLRITLNNGEQLLADVVLSATGRVPNTKHLSLDAVGVRTDKVGAVVVDTHYQTNVPSVYALGDVTNRMQLTPVALGEAMQLVDHLFGPAAGKAPRQMDYRDIPTAVFTHPNIGTVGLSEAQAREQYDQVRVYKSEFKALKHTLSGSTERTLMKLVVDDATDRVVGLHMVGAEASEIVQGFAVAIKAGATKAVFDQTIGIHPTVAEEFVTMREPVSR